MTEVRSLCFLKPEFNKMATNKEKLLEIQKFNPGLHQEVVDGKMSVSDAYNEAKRLRLGLTEYRGTNTRKKEFATDFKRIMALHNPTQEELVTEIKKAFPLTWKTFIKEI